MGTHDYVVPLHWTQAMGMRLFAQNDVDGKRMFNYMTSNYGFVDAYSYNRISISNISLIVAPCTAG